MQWYPQQDPNYVTQMNLGLVPTLWPGRDVLGFAVVHQTMPVVHLAKELCGQWQQEKIQVDSPRPCIFSAP